MLRYQVKAGKITHLTDARYFGAMGVHWLGIDVDHLQHPVQDYKEIIDWVEGPIFIPESELWGEEEWNGFLEFVPCDWIQCREPMAINVKQIITQASHKDTDHFQLVIADDDNFEQISNIPNLKRVILDISAVAFAKISSLDLSLFGGIQLCGSEEEKLGFKSYDDLDEVLESMMDEQ